MRDLNFRLITGKSQWHFGIAIVCFTAAEKCGKSSGDATAGKCAEQQFQPVVM